MSHYDISQLFEHTISQMPDRFDSHEFILRLAQHLNKYPELIKQIGTVQSKNIFGQVNACAAWEKVSNKN